MLSESTSLENRSAAAFWWRLVDNLFRRRFWFLLPILIFGGLGVLQASQTPELYVAGGRLTVASNPLVPEQPIGGVVTQFWETPAQSTSRIINERLLLDRFTADIADEAGLTDAIDGGLVQLATVRNSGGASASGDSILTVSASWEDPQVAFDLVVAAIAGYETFVAESVSSQAIEAEAFYREQLDVFEAERLVAIDELSAFAEEHPGSEEDLSFALQIELENLREGVRSVEAQIVGAREQIDLAALQQTQQKSEVRQSLTVIDAPTIPTAPQSTLAKQITLVISFLMLGVITSIAALLVTTFLDQSVASPADALGIPGVPLVATAPFVADLALAGGRQRHSASVGNRRRRSP